MRALMLAAVIAAALASPAGTAARAGASTARPTATAGAALPAFNAGFRQAPANATLNGISCQGAMFCLAVGSYTNELSQQRSSAQLWDGTRWRVLGGVPGGGLSGVSCASTSFCVAVGSVIDTWNGRTWKRLSHPVTPPPVVLSGVSCTSAAFCMAVGTGNRGETNIAQAWNGSAWRSLSTPANGCVPFCGLSAVACLSAFRCMAVGGTGNLAGTEDFSEAIRWNGRRWLETRTPQGHVSTSLSGVSCHRLASGTWNCVAVGNYTSESPACNCVLADEWNGSSWQEFSTPPVTGGLTGVFCAATRMCDAVGGSLAFSLHGSTWTQETIAQPGETGTSLRDISCWAPSHCIAVGSYTEASGARLTLAEEESLGSWAVLRTNSPGDPFAGLSGVSCPFPFACVAVGAYVPASDGYGALAERWDGHRWSVMLTRSPGTQVTVLTSVSCPNAHDCMAVGYFDSAGTPQTLAEQWNGTSWSVLPAAHIGTLNSVSCPAPGPFCAAVGSYIGAQGHRFALAETWNGTSWQVQPTPEPGATISQLSGIWCNSAVNCTAVGTYNTSLTRTLKPLTVRWNGSWQMQANPGGSRQLGAISCPGPTHCVSVGSDIAVHGPHLPSGTVSMLRNGMTWTVVSAANPRSQLMPRLNGVSCRDRFRCKAGGGAVQPSGDVVPLVEAWGGTSWRIEPVPVPRSAFNQLYAVSCSIASPIRCVAVGATGAQRTLAVRWNGTGWHLVRTPNP